MTEAHLKRKKLLYGLSLGFSSLGLLWFGYWWLWGQFREYTDDAYVSGNLIYITPQVSGIVTQIFADDTEQVEEGQLLIELDKTDYILTLEQRKAELAQVVRTVAALFLEEQELLAATFAAKEQFQEKGQDYERRLGLTASGSISQEEFAHAESALVTAYYTLVSLEQKTLSLLAQIDKTTPSTHPLVQEAIAKLTTAWVNLQRCNLYSPRRGILAKRRAQVGQRVLAGENILAVVPLEEMWIEANFKETQLRSMQIGQPVHIRTDLYGSSIPYQGQVIGIGIGTGSVFSLLPPQNATGNWIKIVQRVPVRIALLQNQMALHPLRLGLSVEAVVDTHNLHVSSIPDIVTPRTLYQTSVFTGEEEGAKALIQEILQANLPSEMP